MKHIIAFLSASFLMMNMASAASTFWCEYSEDALTMVTVDMKIKDPKVKAGFEKAEHLSDLLKLYYTKGSAALGAPANSTLYVIKGEDGPSEHHYLAIPTKAANMKSGTDFKITEIFQSNEIITKTNPKGIRKFSVLCSVD